MAGRRICGRVWRRRCWQDYVHELKSGGFARVRRLPGSYATGRGPSRWCWAAAFYHYDPDVVANDYVFEVRAKTAKLAIIELRRLLVRKAHEV
jgi:hypothetical protein